MLFQHQRATRQGQITTSDTTQQDQADENTQQSEVVQTSAQQCGYTNLAMSNISEGNLNIRGRGYNRQQCRWNHDEAQCV